jgi:tetratricopeptide (TPR) repeat protein
MSNAASPDPTSTPGVIAPPFPGLRPFSSRDHKYFFGREDQVFALYRLLRNDHFIAVIGSSGSGKSSIVRAGLLPLLDEENSQSAKPVWQCRAMRPGGDPINRLASALAKSPDGKRDAFFEARRDRITAMLRASSNGISESLAHTAPDANTQLVLLVDQFEELFRYLSAGSQVLDRLEIVRRREEATMFVQLLLAATRSYDSRVRVVITMRSDFIGDCARFQALPEAVSAAQFLVPSLSRDQREEAIRKPIELSGAMIDSELVERLLNDSGDDVDQLPVLQHCLARLWMRAGELPGQPSPTAATDLSPDSTAPVRHLTEQEYKAIGGLAGALSGHADEIAKTLVGKENTVEQIFRALAEMDKEGRAIRRARPLAQLIEEIGGAKADAFAVLDAFRADDCSFLVPPLSLGPSSELPGETIIDVGHEALLRRWTRVSGDPEATGEHADKRNIGWLRQEQRDGERYQFLRSCVDPESANESRLSEDQVRRYSRWWESWKPNRAWAARYGGRFDEVDRLIKDSEKSRWRSKATKLGAAAAASLLIGAALVVFFISRQQQQYAEAFFKVTLNSLTKTSHMILESFNAGQISADAANKLTTEAVELYKKANSVNKNSSTAAVEGRWLLTSADIQYALGDKPNAQENSLNAMTSARKYKDEEPENRDWLELLYESLFRLGDIDLDQSVAQHDRKYSEQALLEYQEAEKIADRLLSDETARPRETHLADVDYLAKQRFDLAFATNKVGETLLVQGDIKGAIAKYKEALPLARMIERTARMDWKIQSATTKIKIAVALMKQAPADLDGAVQFLSEAIGREEEIFAENPSDFIVRSNLAGAYETRARALLQDKKFDAVFQSYEAAIKLLKQLTEDDARDTKWLDLLARAHSRYGEALEKYAGSHGLPLDRAIEEYKSEVAIRERLVQRAPKNAEWIKNAHERRNNLQRIMASAGSKPEKATSAE